MQIKILITGGNGNIARILKNNLNSKFDISSPGRQELNLLEYNNIENYLLNKEFDICFHTAIIGGRRTKEESHDVFYYNILMFENLVKFSHRFKMIINMDSGAIYDRKTNILNRKEYELYSVPTDFYGFSKYCIYKRSLSYSNIFNFRIFNIFFPDEEPDRFIKLCVTQKELIINEDKYFDFFYYLDFIRIVEYYISNINNLCILDKTINICYKQKYKLSEIAKIVNSNLNIIILSKETNNNYSGSSNLIEKLPIKICVLEDNIIDYKNKIYKNI
jgi:nucleoside-diphosphate-sugar epimerase